MGVVLTVVSGKGGVGKTTAAINIAHTLHQFGRNTILVDSNTKSPNIGISLGFSDVDHTLNDVVRKKKNIKDVAYMHYSGLKVILSKLSDNLSPEHFKNIKDVLEELKEAVEIVVIDTAPHHISETIEAMKNSDYLVVITTPDMPSITEALKTIRLAKHLKKKVLGVVVNRYKGKSYEISPDNIERITEHKIIAIIPEDENVPLSVRIKHPVVYSHPDSPASHNFKKLAANLIGQDYKPSVKDDIDDRLFTKLLRLLKK